MFLPPLLRKKKKIEQKPHSRTLLPGFAVACKVLSAEYNWLQTVLKTPVALQHHSCLHTPLLYPLPRLRFGSAAPNTVPDPSLWDPFQPSPSSQQAAQLSGSFQAGKAVLLPLVRPALPPALRCEQFKFISHRLCHRLLLSGMSPRGTNP